VGDLVTRRSRLLSATPKQGRSGASVFVTVRNDVLVDGIVVQVEESWPVAIPTERWSRAAPESRRR